MNNLEYTVVIGLGSAIAGFFGSLTGLGGGAFLVPLLTLGLGVDIRYAIGASLVSIIATSSGAAAAYVKEGFTNLRLAMLLCVATTLGALFGAFLALKIQTAALSVIFGVVLIISAYLSIRKRKDLPPDTKPDSLAMGLKLYGTYPSSKGMRAYQARNVPMGFGIMWLAGVLSGLLGIGSGAVKVLALDQVMRIPFKVSTSTSNLMIGVTASASAGLYITRGYVDPFLSMPVMLGVLVGAFCGARVMSHANTALLRRLFGVVVFILSIQMIYNGWKAL
jgi:uncharacterized membrane protein YfcA